jgi:hypothetical protein
VGRGKFRPEEAWKKGIRGGKTASGGKKSLKRGCFLPNFHRLGKAKDAVSTDFSRIRPPIREICLPPGVLLWTLTEWKTRCANYKPGCPGKF